MEILAIGSPSQGRGTDLSQTQSAKNRSVIEPLWYGLQRGGPLPCRR